MSRFFNTAGPCELADHYMLPPLPRLPLLRRYIDRKQYVVLHAARQIGKTTAVRALAETLTAEGTYAAALVSAEMGAAFPGEIGKAEDAMLSWWTRTASTQFPPELRPPPWPHAPQGARVQEALSAWARTCPRPLVLFIDEIDALPGEVLLSVLRQLRVGYSQRPEHFPWSVVLVGLRDVRDYETNDDQGRMGTSSPFNIKVESLTMQGFSLHDVAELYAQHTTDTGQTFADEACDRAFELTQGQPWLVNALAREVVDTLVVDRDTTITAADIDRAARVLVQRQDTHLDSLSKRLREPRIRSIIEPMLSGDALDDIPRDDRRFALDLGLVRLSDDGGLVVANPIYREVIVEDLVSGPRASLPKIAPTWLDEQGRLDPHALRDAFIAFWRQHGSALLRSAPYHEVAAQLVLMAFLHRVVNGGGSIEREYAIGRDRIDLCLRLGGSTLAMELKVWRDHRADPLERGLAQLDGYLDGLGLDSGWLVIFDQRSDAGRVAERTRAQLATSPAGRSITVLRA
ncbi:MAG: ATP-binding protein [Nannocystaceae bacterium]